MFAEIATAAPQSASAETMRAGKTSLKNGRLAAHLDRLLAPRLAPKNTVVVSGFWRSGTTWLQEALAELLQAKTLFEPFHYMTPTTKRLFKYYHVAQRGRRFQELFIPYCAPENFDGHFLQSYYERALRGDVPGFAVRVLRRSLQESLRTRLVVKFTRGQFSLHAAQQAFDMPVIHVYRDPRAVIASAKLTDWYWMFDHLSLRAQLLEIKDGRRRHFEQWEELFRLYEDDKVARLAAYWAITEKFLYDAFADRRSRIVIVNYQALLRRKEELMAEMLERLGVKIPARRRAAKISRDSYSTSETRKGASTEERLAGWRKVLTPEEITTIERIVRRFGLEERLRED